ncbi:MAG: hypothetical protein NC818_02410 [Candidatus Omnitrophica bacterium]|nr:hypothetical protein [Candidatus Omnitrophota bacterium]
MPPNQKQAYFYLNHLEEPPTDYKIYEKLEQKSLLTEQFIQELIKAFEKFVPPNQKQAYFYLNHLEEPPTKADVLDFLKGLGGFDQASESAIKSFIADLENGKVVLGDVILTGHLDRPDTTAGGDFTGSFPVSTLTLTINVSPVGLDVPGGKLEITFGSHGMDGKISEGVYGLLASAPKGQIWVSPVLLALVGEGIKSAQDSRRATYTTVPMGTNE